jgi:hypothetical protein
LDDTVWSLYYTFDFILNEIFRESWIVEWKNLKILLIKN